MLPRPRSFCAAICPANGPGVSSSSHTPPPPARLTLHPPPAPPPAQFCRRRCALYLCCPSRTAATTRPGQCCRIARPAAPHAHSDEQHESHYQNGLVPVCVEPGPWPLNFLSPQRWAGSHRNSEDAVLTPHPTHLSPVYRAQIAAPAPPCSRARPLAACPPLPPDVDDVTVICHAVCAV